MPADSALFDTNIVIDILAGVPAARKEYDNCPDRAISVVTWMEVMIGVQPNEEARVLDFLATFTQVPLSQAIAQRTVEVRRSTRLKLPDAVLLATAMIEARIMLTRNTRDFPADTDNVRVPYQV